MGNNIFTKKPCKDDLDIIKKVNNMEIPYWYPINRMIEGSESRRNDKFGITHVHHFFTRRNLFILSKFYSCSYQSKYSHLFNSALGSSLARASVRNRYMPKYGNRQVGVLSGTLYTPTLFQENNIINSLKSRIKRIARTAFAKSEKKNI